MPEQQGDSNQNNPQELPSSGLSKPPEMLSKKVRSGFKKQIAGRIVGAAALLSVMGIPADTVPNYNFSQISNPEATQSLSVQDLEKKAEQLYHIQIASTQEGIVTLADGTEVKPSEWTKDEIANLMEALDKLPPHFYLPGAKDVRISLPSLSGGHGYGIDPSKDKAQEEKNAQAWLQQIKQQDDRDDTAAIRKSLGRDFSVSKEQLDEARKQGYFEKKIGKRIVVRFILVDSVPLDTSPNKEKNIEYWAQCYCGTSFDQPDVLLEPSVFNPRDIEKTFEDIVHELTHRVSTQEDYKFVANLLGLPEYAIPDFRLFSIERVNAMMVAQMAAHNDIDAKIYDRFRYSVTNPNEFVSVASEFYIQGKEVFLRDYGLFIGHEKAGNLYRYVRDRIFKGQEYLNYEKISNQQMQQK